MRRFATLLSYVGLHFGARLAFLTLLLVTTQHLAFLPPALSTHGLPSPHLCRRPGTYLAYFKRSWVRKENGTAVGGVDLGAGVNDDNGHHRKGCWFPLGFGVADNYINFDTRS